MEKSINDIEKILAAIVAEMGDGAPTSLRTLLAAVEKRNWSAVDAQRRAMKAGAI